jgi:hypothetical protein
MKASCSRAGKRLEGVKARRRTGEHVADTSATMIHEPEFNHIAPRRK